MTKSPEPVVTGDLKLCPFCGGDAHTRFHGLEQTWSVECGQCQAQMPYVGLSKAEAVAAWNTRTAHALPGDVGRLERALRDVNDRVAAYGSEALGRTINDIVNAALTPSPCPGDGRREADIALLGARMVLEGKATNATGALAKTDWKPSRAHIEGMRNTMREAIEYIDEARAALTPSALSGDALREAWISDAVDTACDGENGKTNGGDWEERWQRSKVRAALTPSALSGGDYAEAFDILVDVQSALVLTADHSQGATVASFVSSSTQYERLNRFLHERQHADPRSASALSGDVGRLERALRDVNDRVAAYGSEALGRTINDIVNAALAPSALSETNETLDDLVNKPVGGDFSLRAFNVVRCLANAEFRSELDRCKDEAEYLMASLKEPGLPKYLRIGFPELEALHYLSTTPSALSGDAGEVVGSCHTCGHDAADMRRRLDDLVIAARNHWGAGSDPHNLIRDVSDAILRHRKSAALTSHQGAGEP